VRACQRLKNLYYRPPFLRSAARCASRARTFRALHGRARASSTGRCAAQGAVISTKFR
jgi:hypothetical protein